MVLPRANSVKLSG